MNQIILLNTPIIQLFFPPFNCILLRAIQSGSARRESKGRDGIKCTLCIAQYYTWRVMMASFHLPPPLTIQYGCAINQYPDNRDSDCNNMPDHSNQIPDHQLLPSRSIGHHNNNNRHVDKNDKSPSPHPTPTHLIGLNRACMSLG